MKKILLAGVLASMLCTSQAYAAFEKQDYLLEGDNQTLYDSTTNLWWLDLGVTDGMSVAQVTMQTGAGGQFEGWRVASAAEVESLIRSIMPSLTFNQGQTAFDGVQYRPQALEWISLLGGVGDANMSNAYGFYRSEGGTLLMTGARTFGSTNAYIFDDYSMNGYTFMHAAPGYGVFLVSGTAPIVGAPEVSEPSPSDVPAPFLGGLAMFGLALMGIRRKR